jgi:hypothetical protein
MDTEMTQRRVDLKTVKETVNNLPMGRAAFCNDVTSLISFFIENPNSYISNQEIGLNGGKFARMSWL